ncbi:hypothetical protein GH714_008022 [Hevea brasiliensis]|uniref:Ubiquitin-like domain-containing protein n=1 Tax=Hevea brasiliensis TaxID=3981 RepID=A0A6A6KYQ2_HEVBR|nr:hypothetical protein GH714_008022 [Hevea brasiliensis]
MWTLTALADDDEEYEEVDGGNRLLGFMFGNVDNSGDLDVDYLDEDAKEHLGALADKLGPSLTDIDLSMKSTHTSADAAEQDYDEKAEDAVDYEDIDEQYEGPEIQAASEEDHLLPKKQYFSSQVSLATLEPETSVFDDENYDEEEETEKEHVVVDKNLEVQGQQEVVVIPGVERSPLDGTQFDSMDTESLDADLEDLEEEKSNALEGPLDGQASTPLPVLCIEDGMVILRFSEIFGIHEPLKKGDKRDYRYSIFKEKYKCMDVSDIVEEDEEAFLKGSSKVFQLQSHGNQYDVSVFNDDGSESGNFGIMQGSVQNEKQRSSCVSAEPMNKDLSVNPFTGRQSLLCSKFDPLDQQDWEDRILWDNSPSVSDNSVEGCDLSEHDLGDSFLKETERVRPSDLPLSEGRCHPQLLRLESQLEGEKYHDVDGRKENNAVEIFQSGSIRRFSRLTLQNRDVMEGSWLDEIIWEPNKANVKPKLILDLQDEQMLFEVLDNKDSKHLQLHAGAMIITRSLKPGKISQQLPSNSSKRSAYGTRVHHSAPAIKLQTMKLKLSNKDLANFHRPKALWYPHDNEVAVKEQKKLPTQGPMKIILKSLGGKGSKLHVDAEETVSSVKAKASKKLDFKPSEMVKIFYLGKELEDHKSLAAQNVQPNSLLHLVRTKIHLLPKAQRIPGDNKSLRPPGAFKKKSDLSVKDGHVFLMEYCEERPLLLSNFGMGANLCTYYQKSSPSDQTGILLRNGNSSLGNVMILEPTDKSPFLGDIKAGCSQSSLETNMYKAPVFPTRKLHSSIRLAHAYDFLLYTVLAGDYLDIPVCNFWLRNKKISGAVFDNFHQEPLMEVLSPGSKNLQAYIINRLLVYVYREFRAAEKSGTVPWIHADELSAQFPSLSETILRKKLKECAVLRKDSNGYLFWSKKRDFIIPTEEELKKLVLPENVCAYESMQAGLYRLKHLGITRLILPTSASSAMSQLPDEAIALAAASHIEGIADNSMELEQQLCCLYKPGAPLNLSVGRPAAQGGIHFLVAVVTHDVTTWGMGNACGAESERREGDLTDVPDIAEDRENIERLEITGVGDPSGRGLGFSYVRAAPKAPVSNAMVKKKAAAGRGGSTVTGTDADLRRLSMEAAREVLLKFNVPEEQIAKQTRWHRIAMIRKLSSEQAASGVKVDPTTISKYARGQRMSFLQLQQQTREKCQEIWDRQVQSLSAVDGDENESDSEANSDLDSFAGDLENLLDAEECEGDEGNYESKHDKADGVKGLKMRRRPFKVQAEEEIEDEAAEAAELCRLLMDDEEAAEQKKKKKTKTTGIEAGLVFGSKSNFIDNAERIKKTKKVHPNGSYITKENSNRDFKEVETLFGKRKMSDKVKAMKNNATSDSSTPRLKAKVKILGEGLKAMLALFLFLYVRTRSMDQKLVLLYRV